jgi:hypothetical protein
VAEQPRSMSSDSSSDAVTARAAARAQRSTRDGVDEHVEGAEADRGPDHAMRERSGSLMVTVMNRRFTNRSAVTILKA